MEFPLVALVLGIVGDERLQGPGNRMLSGADEKDAKVDEPGFAERKHPPVSAHNVAGRIPGLEVERDPVIGREIGLDVGAPGYAERRHPVPFPAQQLAHGRANAVGDDEAAATHALSAIGRLEVHRGHAVSRVFDTHGANTVDGTHPRFGGVVAQLGIEFGSGHCRTDRRPVSARPLDERLAPESDCTDTAADQPGPHPGSRGPSRRVQRSRAV